MDRGGSTVETQRRRRARTEPFLAAEGRPGADRLSSLPDELLLRILSFLEIRDAIPTSRLSRRWRYLWHSLPSLDLSSVAWEQPHAWIVDRVLLLHAAPRIERFLLLMRADGTDVSFSRQIDSWILFSARRGVRVLDLDFVVDDESGFDPLVEARYALPPWLFGCESLEDLSVRLCYLRLPGHIRLSSLKKMHLRWVGFHGDQLKRLLLGCPLLQILTLVSCNSGSNLVIDARGNRHLEELDIDEENCDADLRSEFEDEMQIYAPSLKCMRFYGATTRRRYVVSDLSSLVMASFCLDKSWCWYKDDPDVFEDLLVAIRQVQVLDLCRWSLHALSIRERQGVGIPSCFNVTSLKLTTGLDELELLGAFSAFRACNKLRTLDISILPKGIYVFETESLRLRSCALSSEIVMQHLKTIKIQGLVRNKQDPGGEENERN